MSSKRNKPNREPSVIITEQDETNSEHRTREQLEKALREGAHWEETPPHVHNPPSDAVNGYRYPRPYVVQDFFWPVILGCVFSSFAFAAVLLISSKREAQIHAVPGAEITKDAGR